MSQDKNFYQMNWWNLGHFNKFFVRTEAVLEGLPIQALEFWCVFWIVLEAFVPWSSHAVSQYMQGLGYPLHGLTHPRNFGRTANIIFSPFLLFFSRSTAVSAVEKSIVFLLVLTTCFRGQRFVLWLRTTMCWNCWPECEGNVRLRQSLISQHIQSFSCLEFGLLWIELMWPCHGSVTEVLEVNE